MATVPREIGSTREALIPTPDDGGRIFLLIVSSSQDAGFNPSRRPKGPVSTNDRPQRLTRPRISPRRIHSSLRD